MITHQEVLRVTQTTSKHLPDTLRHLPDNPKSINVGIVKGSGRNFLSLLGKPVVKYNDVIFFMCFQLLFHKYSLGNIQNQSDSVLKPFRHPQTQYNHLSIQLSIVLIGWFLFSQWPALDRIPSWISHWVPYFKVFVGSLADVWEVSGGCVSDSGYCLGKYDVQAIDKHPI